MSVVRVNVAQAELLETEYNRAATTLDATISGLSSLLAEANWILETRSNPLYGPLPSLQETASGLHEDRDDLTWRVDYLQTTDAQDLGNPNLLSGYTPSIMPDGYLDKPDYSEALAAFRRAEAQSSNERTPLEQADHSLNQIRTILDTAKHDRGRGIGATVPDSIWSTEDLEAVITNEHDYYTPAQQHHAQTVLNMANSSPEARDHLGITQSNNGWSFADIGHLTLDIFGLVPIVGNAADGINAAWYAAEGEYLDAALSSIALIPALGQIVAPARHTIRAAANGRAFRSLDDALAWVKAWIESTGLWRFGDEVAEGANSASNVAQHQQYLEELRRIEVEGTPGPPAARQAADDALARGQANGAAAQFEIDGRTFVDTSGSSTPLHSSVDEALESIPSSQRSPWHGQCAEPRCVSQAIEAGLEVSTGVMDAVQIGNPARIPHGNLRPPCSSCAGLQEIFGYAQ